MDFNNFYVFSMLLLYGSAERLHEKIYSEISGGSACFRRLNGTHQFGCSSGESGAVGVVQMITDLSDAEWLVFNASAGPYIGVVSTVLFHDVIHLFIEYPKDVAGILLYDNATEKASFFTQESKCPNEYSSSRGSQCSSSGAGGNIWNEKGTSLLRSDIPFPIFYLPESSATEIQKIQVCNEKYNLDRNNQKGRPLCSLQLNSFMYAAVNTVVCMRRSATSTLLNNRRVCDPLGDYNVYYSSFPMQNDKKSTKKKVILVTGRLDAASMFHDLAPGAASTVVGVVTLLTAAKTLADMLSLNDSSSYDKNVLWTLFNGESFDYIGSQRVAYDIAQGAWPPAAPLTPADICLHVEVGQIGGALRTSANHSWPLYAFAPLPYDSTSEAKLFVEGMESNLNRTNITVVTENLPPSSLHSFRRILNSTIDGELPEILIADFNTTFTNMYYNSVLDTYDKIGFNYRNISIGKNGTFVPTSALIANGTFTSADPQVHVARLATALARALYQRVAGRPYHDDGNVASAHLVDEMLYCFLKSQACKLLVAADYAPGGDGGGETAPPATPDAPAPLYVGVTPWNNTAAVFAGHMLALLTGTHLPVNRTACDELAQHKPEFSHYFLRGWNNSGVCVQTTMNFSQAISPAFTIPDYSLPSGVYSSWTESVWATTSARVFVSASGGGARAAAAGGAAATLLAAALTHWLRRRAGTVFALPPHTAALAGNVDAATGSLCILYLVWDMFRNALRPLP